MITTLGQVMLDAEQKAEHCYDETIPVREISFDSLERIRIGCEPFALQETAQRQIANRLGVPFPYLERCSPNLQQMNLNFWLKEEANDAFFVRFNQDEVRAIFTPKYKPTDDLDVLVELETLGFDLQTQVQAHVDSAFTLLNIPNPIQAFEISRNDKVLPGISITNSEVGRSSLSISSWSMRLTCSNGMISPTKVNHGSYRHVSNDLKDKIPQMIAEAAKGSGRIKDQFAISLQSRVKDPTETFERLNRQFQLTETERDAVTWGWGFEGCDDPTMFNIVQTYTKGAQHPQLSAESAYTLQKTGGRVLEMVQ